MTGSDAARWEQLARRYALSEQAEWRKLLAHFDLAEGFAFVVLLAPDADGAVLCRHELEQQLQGEGRALHAVEIASPADLHRLPEHFLEVPASAEAACLWIAAVAPDYTPDYAAWRDAWEHALARLNAFRNPIRDRFQLTLIFAGAPWLQEVLREIAPDLWSVRTLVVRIEPAARPADESITMSQSSESTVADGPDPLFALEQAEKLRGVAGKELALAHLLDRAGEGYVSRGNLRWAEKAFVEALEIKLRHTNLLATLNELAWTCQALGQPRRSLALAEQALALAREVGDRQHEGTALRRLGLAYTDLGETWRAIEYHEQALAIAREVDDRRGEGYALNNLGLSYTDLGETRRAIEYHEQALAIAREVDDRRHEGSALNSEGNAYYVLGETRRAIKYYEQALAIVREIGDQRGAGNALMNLGNAYADLGETQRAIEYYGQVLNLFRDIGDRRGEGNILWNMSLALDELGERAQAIAHAEAALSIYEQTEDPRVDEVRRQLEQWRDAVE